jgi:hypothetical protein
MLDVLFGGLMYRLCAYKLASLCSFDFLDALGLQDEQVEYSNPFERVYGAESCGWMACPSHARTPARTHARTHAAIKLPDAIGRAGQMQIQTPSLCVPA